jgi:hypothetical protein
MKTMILPSPAQIRVPTPPFATAAPTRPPISACEELEGMP